MGESNTGRPVKNENKLEWRERRDTGERKKETMQMHERRKERTLNTNGEKLPYRAHCDAANVTM